MHGQPAGGLATKDAYPAAVLARLTSSITWSNTDSTF